MMAALRFAESAAFRMGTRRSRPAEMNPSVIRKVAPRHGLYPGQLQEMDGVVEQHRMSPTRRLQLRGIRLELFAQSQQQSQLTVLANALVPPGVCGQGEKDSEHDDHDLEASSLEPATPA